MTGAFLIKDHVEILAGYARFPIPRRNLKRLLQIGRCGFSAVNVIQRFLQIVQRGKTTANIQSLQRIFPSPIPVGLVTTGEAAVGWNDTLHVDVVRLVGLPAVIVMSF